MRAREGRVVLSRQGWFHTAREPFLVAPRVLLFCPLLSSFLHVARGMSMAWCGMRGSGRVWQDVVGCGRCGRVWQGVVGCGRV